MDHSPQNLTERDGELLNNLFALDQNLFQLAQHEQLPLHQLLAWSTQPHIQAAIDHLTRFLEAGHKAAAIAHLRHTADTTQDPIERRRACTTLLRALAPRGNTRSTRATDRDSARSVPQVDDIPTASPPEGRASVAGSAAANGGQLPVSAPSNPPPGRADEPSLASTGKPLIDLSPEDLALPFPDQIDPEVLAILPDHLRRILIDAAPARESPPDLGPSPLNPFPPPPVPSSPCPSRSDGS